MAGIIDMVTSFGIDPARRVDWGLDRLLAILDAQGIQRAYTLSRRAIHYAGPDGNDETLQVCRRHEGLEPVAVIDPRRYVDAHDDARRRFEQGCRLFRFFPGEQGWPIAFMPFVKICETLAGLGARAIVPVGGYGDATAIAERLGELELPVLLIGGNYATLGELLAVLPEYPRLFCDGHMMNSPYGLATVIEHCGEERLIFGSDAPVKCPESPLLVAEHAGITDEQRRRYLRDNALAFVGEDA